jgi:sugar phosphate permease
MDEVRPTRVRHLMLGIALVVAVLLYLDRYCLTNAGSQIRDDLGFSRPEMAALLGAFFLPYALGQIPLGYLVDRYGPRRMLTLLMFFWSLFTALLGLSQGYADFYLYRFGCGLFESGGYPACAGIIRRWIPVSKRGMASGIVSVGGRFGGAITPRVTTALMAFFAIALPQFHSWRPTLFVFGAFGIVLAIVFWFVFTDSPAEHPRCNQAEIDLIGATPNLAPAAFTFPWRSIVKNRSLWISSFIQFGSNFGQVMFGTLLNDYLKDVQLVDDIGTRSWMTGLVFGMGVPALLLGGWLTDAAIKRHGVRWGIALPMALPRFVAGLLFMVVPLITIWMPETSVERAWVIILVLGCVSFFSDMTLPSIWAFNLTVGGRMVGLVLGWGNMWGNLGGWRSPNEIQTIIQNFGWNAVFFTCGGVFLTIATASLFIDAREKLNDA